MELSRIYECTIDGDTAAVKELTHQALAEGIAPAEIVSRYLIPAMAEVGARYARSEFFVPELLIAARSMHAALAILKPLLSATDLKSAGTVVIGTVEGDMHDIGKNLVSMMLQGAGFQVVDLGVDVSPDAFVEAVREHRADALALSSLLTTSMGSMQRTMVALTEAGLRERVKVFIGGAPVTERYAADIGADAYGRDAGAAVSVAKDLLHGS